MFYDEENKYLIQFLICRHSLLVCGSDEVNKQLLQNPNYKFEPDTELLSSANSPTLLAQLKVRLVGGHRMRRSGREFGGLLRASRQHLPT